MGGKATLVVDEVTLRQKERAKELEPIGKKKKKGTKESKGSGKLTGKERTGMG